MRALGAFGARIRTGVHMRKSRYVLAASAVAVAVVGLAPGAASARGSGASAPVVVVSGLNNPRQLSLVNDDVLLVAEAGKGGATEVPGPPGEDSEFVGATGSVSLVVLPRWAHDTTPNRVVTGLMSGAGQDGSFAAGSDGVSARSLFGPIFIQETYAPPDVLPAPFGTKQDGRLLAARPYGSHLISVANISKFESDHDPDHKGFDSNPYAVLALPGGELVADAAGNDVLWVNKRGDISVFHVFANVKGGACAGQFDPDANHPGCNFVPTSLAQDAQGHIFVGGLVSEVPGEGRVVELSGDGKTVLRVAKGFTSVTGVAVGRDGAIYVSQLEANEANPPAPQVVGVLTRIGPNGGRKNIDVPFPAGVAVDRHDDVYVSAWSVASEAGLAGPGTSGQVWRLHF